MSACSANFSIKLTKTGLAAAKSCRLNSRNACSKARTAASVPGEGGFLGGAGRGFGASIRRLASAALLDRIFAAGLLTAGGLASAFLCERPLAALLLIPF